MNEETAGVPQGALPPREAPQSGGGPRVVAERPAAVRLAQVGGQYLLTTTTNSTQQHGVPALAQLTPGATRIISISQSRVNQSTSPLRPSQANQSIVNVLTRSRPTPNVRLQLFTGDNNAQHQQHQHQQQQQQQQQLAVVPRVPVKRSMPSTEKKETYASKLQHVMNHRIVRSKLIKEKYSEHLMEAYFLEAGGTILDLYQFAKKPKTQPYLNYLREHAIDPRD